MPEKCAFNIIFVVSSIIQVCIYNTVSIRYDTLIISTRWRFTCIMDVCVESSGREGRRPIVPDEEKEGLEISRRLQHLFFCSLSRSVVSPIDAERCTGPLRSSAVVCCFSVCEYAHTLSS